MQLDTRGCVKVWFEVVPGPGGRWRFAVKIDRAPTLDHVADRVATIPDAH